MMGSTLEFRWTVNIKGIDAGARVSFCPPPPSEIMNVSCTKEIFVFKNTLNRMNGLPFGLIGNEWFILLEGVSEFMQNCWICNLD